MRRDGKMEKIVELSSVSGCEETAQPPPWSTKCLMGYPRVAARYQRNVEISITLQLHLIPSKRIKGQSLHLNLGEK
jgi:hypothetical protein